MERTEKDREKACARDPNCANGANIGNSKKFKDVAHAQRFSSSSFLLGLRRSLTDCLSMLGAFVGLSGIVIDHKLVLPIPSDRYSTICTEVSLRLHGESEHTFD